MFLYGFLLVVSAVGAAWLNDHDAHGYAVGVAAAAGYLIGELASESRRRRKQAKE